MKTITVSARAKTLRTLFKQAESGGLILRSPDGHEFILAEIDDFDREIELTRKNKRLMKLLDKRAKQSETVSLGDVRARVL